jgi:hypothetical protein
MNLRLLFNPKFYALRLSIFMVFSCFTFSFLQAQTQPCNTPNIGTTSVGEPFNIAIGKGKNDVYLGATVPTYRDILGVNFAIYQLENNKLATYLGPNMSNATKSALDVFSSIRVFYPTHRDYWNFSDSLVPPYAAKSQVPINNMSNLRLITDNSGYPLLGAGQTGKVVYPVASTTSPGKVNLVTEPLKSAGAYYNVYANYVNNNWIKFRGSFDNLKNSSLPISKKFSAALEVFPANFQQNTPYEFPNNWFLSDDWGLTDAERKLNAKAYAMMFARAYSPKTSDCATCPSMVETIEIGNEPWGYKATTYQAIIQGFTEGFADYYGTDTLNKIRLLPASFQAHHAENTTTANVNDINSWKDYLNDRLPASSKCDLEGVNLHLYSNTIQGSNLTLNTSFPEKVAQVGTQTTALSHFYYVRNAWKWLKDNEFAKKNLYITEFGWDSDGCTPDKAVGMKTQAIYTIRNLLMMGRYGVKKANLYQIEDDPNAGCGFAYFSSGVFDTKRTPKYIFKALENFIQKTGATKFHYALREDPNDVHAYILETNNQPKCMVAWLARDINYVDDTKTLSQVIALGGADLSDGVGALKPISLNFNGKNYTPDATLPWYRLDGETAGPLSINTYFVGGQYKLSPVPILIPIVESCNPDAQTPIFANCPVNIALTTTGTTAIATWTAPTATDNCTTSPTVTSTHISGATFPIGATTVTYTAKDSSNNAATCAFTVTVTNPCANDTVKPVFANCPVNIAQNTTDTVAIVTWAAPNATDNCGTPTLSNTHNSGGTFKIGTTNVIYTAKDAKNNAATCSFTITVANPCLNDTIAPIFADCPTDIMQSTAATADSVWWTPPTVTDNCTATPTMTATHTSGSLFPVGTTKVTYTAKDAKNNTATCSFKIVMDNPCLNDTTAPIFSTCPGNISKITSDSAAIAAWVLPDAFDDCAETPTITGSHVSGSSFKIGTTKVTFTAKDDKNNTSTCIFNVIVTNPCLNDTVKPVFATCPANINQTITGTTSVATWVTPTATDNCGVPSVSSTHNAGATFPIGTTTVIYTATDAKNNKSTCSFTVTNTPQATNYCASSGTMPWQEWVAGVKLNTINNMTQANEGKARDFNTVGYSNFLDMQTTLIGGQIYPLSIKSGFSWSGILTDLYCRAWIDFNGNKTFEDNEKVFEGKSLSLFSTNIIVPPYTLKGQPELLTRMRVSVKSGSYPSACDTFIRGEVEDYAINYQSDTTQCGVDRTPPVFTICPANIIQTTTGTTAVVNWTPPIATDDCTLASLTGSHNPNTAFPSGITTVIYTATDGNGNSKTCTFTVTVTTSNPCATDTTKPVFDICPPNITKTTADSAAIATWTLPTATDNCGVPSVSSTHNSGNLFKIGTTTVIYTATDAKNNKATCSFTVTVSNPCANDTTKPVFDICPPNITKTTADSAAIATWTPPTATDNCGVPSVSSTHNSGNSFKIGTTTVIYTATDAKNNKATCSFTVTVSNPCANDTIKPVFDICPPNITKTTADSAAIATWTPPTATDNCGVPSVTSTHNSGNSFKIGTTTVIYTATDAKNNKATCSFTVTVSNPCANDTTKPVFDICPPNITKTTADSAAIATWTPPTATDNCGVPSVSSTHNVGNSFKIGTTTVIYTATDAKNNKATCSFTVTISNPCANDTIKPVFDICPPNITKTTSDSAAIATWTPPTATDNCGVPSVSSTHNSGATFKIGTTTVVYTATDAKNNKATCSFTVTVSNPCANDTTKPVFDFCPPNITKTTADTAAIATWTPPTATDNCGVPSVSSTHNSGNSFKIGTTTVIYTATDAKNNKATCSFTVTVSNPCANDTTKPVFTNCPPNISSIATGGTATATWTAPTATDNCGVPSLSSTHNSGATFPIGTTAVIYTAIDAKNNKNTCTFNVVVAPANTNYCGSKSLEPYQEWVSGVKFGTINNTPQANEGKSINWSVVGYSDFTGLITNVNRGQSYPLNVLSSVSWSGRSADLYCRVWIDFNGDKTFDDTEKVLESRAQNPFIGTVNIPSAAISGNVRMRVSLKWGGFPTACENFTSGEVEDYTINIGGSDCTTDAVAPVFANCPNNISATTSGADAAATWTPPTATDNCTTTPTVTSSHNSGAIFPIGTTTVTYTATDAKNNRSTCVFTVTVTNPCATDVVAPVFTACPNNISRTTQDTAAVATWTPPTATDNCTTPSLSSTYNSGASFKIGTTTVIYTATDAKNNRSICSFTVTVTNPCANDTVPPVFTYCPINIMQTTPATTLTVAWSPPIVTDNCTANPTLTSTHQPNTAFPIGVTTVIYTAKDARNNANTCSFTISVLPPNVNYCASKSSEPYQEWVNGVQFGALTNLIQANLGKSINWSVVGYSDFTSLAAVVNRGQTYPLSITPSTSWSGRLPNLYCRVWIDFNGDKTFDDAEKVMEGRALNVFSGNVLIPTNTTTGNTRMRVSLKWGSLPTACESFIPGEVEDYTVTIR